MKKKKLKRRVPRLPLLYRIIRGGIGKEFVIKHYSYGPIRTKFPDMRNIVASVAQRKCRNRFKEAVKYASSVLADPVLKAAVQRRIKRKHGVFNAMIKEFMLREKRKKELDEIIVARLLYKAFHGPVDRHEIIYINEHVEKPERILKIVSRKCNSG